MIRLRLDGRSTAVRLIIGSAASDVTSLAADPPAAVTLTYLFMPQCSRPPTDRSTVVRRLPRYSDSKWVRPLSRNQLAKELFSILEVFCEILYHQFLRNGCLKSSKGKLKMYLLSKMVANLLIKYCSWYLISLTLSFHPLSNNWTYGYTNYYDLCCFCLLCWFVYWLISAAACCLFIICLSLSVFRLRETVSVKNGWPAR